MAMSDQAKVDRMEPEILEGECNCPMGKCEPEKNVGLVCWRSGFSILASDFPDAVTGGDHG